MRPAIALAARPAWALGRRAGVRGAAALGAPLYALGDLPGTATLNRAATTGGLRALRSTLRGGGGGAAAAGGPHQRDARERLAVTAPTR